MPEKKSPYPLATHFQLITLGKNRDLFYRRLWHHYIYVCIIDETMINIFGANTTTKKRKLKFNYYLDQSILISDILHHISITNKRILTTQNQCFPYSNILYKFTNICAFFHVVNTSRSICIFYCSSSWTIATAYPIEHRQHKQ